jgi:hypothetical protein
MIKFIIDKYKRFIRNVDVIRNKTRKLIKKAWDGKIGSLVDNVGSNGITVGRK